MSVRFPPLLLSAGLLLWGWCADLMLLATIMALLLESPRLHAVRWELSRRDFERAADLCTLAFATTLLYRFVDSRQFPNSLLTALTWLPLLFFLLIAAQRFSSAGAVPLSALFWSLRRGTGASGPVLSLDYAYVSLCALAASAANPRTPWFYAAVCVLAAYALWPAAPRGRARWRWGLLLGGAIAAGWGLHVGLAGVQAKLEELAMDYLASRWNDADPYRARTAIGDIGSLKASDRIALRIDTQGRPPPPRLRQAAYDVYASGTWTTSARNFHPLVPDGDRWSLAAGGGMPVRISAWLDSGRALLALPPGTYRLTALNVAHAERNDLSAIRVMEGPDMLQFDAWSDARAQVESAPGANDLAAPANLAPLLDRVAQEAGLNDQAPQMVAQRLERFFTERFGYSLTLTRADGRARGLGDFLLTDRRGHCEYFATATVLLLRHAGVPARYATGYALQEYSALERQYVVRARHAHAWALAWIDGRWQELDTTPARWAEEESDSASPLQLLYDLASLLNYLVARWRSAPGNPERGTGVWIWMTLPLALFLAWRLYRGRRVRGRAGARPDDGPVSDPRVLAVLAGLARRGYARPAAAALQSWVTRLPLEELELRDALRRFVRDYYRWRFDPSRDDPDLDRALTRQAEEPQRMLHS